MKKNKVKRTVPAFLPSNLDLSSILSDTPPEFEYNIDDFRYILSLITEIPAYNKDVLDNYDYVPINSQRLQGRVRNYNKYLKYLVDNGVIETDNYYIPNEKARGYRFTQTYSTKLKIEHIEKSSLVKAANRKSKFSLNMEKKYKNLKQWFDEDLEIDYEGAIEYLEDELNKNIANGDNNAVLKFNASYVALNNIKDKNYFFIVDGNVGRLHTNLTGVKSGLRNFITYSGKSMVSIDIMNSQPFLSSLILDEKFYENQPNQPKNQQNGGKFIKLSNLSNNKFKSIQSSTHIQSYIMLVKSGGNQDGIGLQSYIEYSTNGELYEFISKRLEETTGRKITDRRSLKTIIFTVLFTDNRFIGQRDAEPKRLFKDLFPAVYEVFSKVKQKDSTVLPRLLQSIEAKIMLERVAKRLSKELPDVPIYTIHDSIACPVGYEDKVAKVMKEELTEATGLTPTLKYEYWTSAQAKGAKPLQAA